MNKRLLNLVKRALPVLTCLLWLSGCGDPPHTLTVIAGSELKDIKPKLAEIEKNTNIKLNFKYIGTLDGADAIVSGEPYDLAWFSHAKYLSLLQGNNKVIKAEEKIGLSPVIPAVKESLARKWGWINNPKVTWSDLAAKAKSGEFRYAMTDPTASNSGFSTVMGVNAAFSGSSDVVTVDTVDSSQLKAFFKGQTLTSGSSGWLAEAFVKDQDQLDGLFNYESILMAMNQSGQLKEPLVLIYPQEGVVTADYPLILLDQNKREPYQRLVEYLKGESFQSWMMEHTNRRPVISKVKPSAKFPKGFQLELSFPSQLDAVNEILFAFLDLHRKPSHSIFVLDTSGSMKGNRLTSLVQAMINLTGQDQSITGQFARFRNREQVTVIEFDGQVKPHKTYEIGAKGQGSETIRKDINALTADGGTAIYDAMRAAYVHAEKMKQQDPDRFYSIVLMSDGDNQNGSTYGDFERYYRQHADQVAGVRSFPILFGNSNDQEMNKLANLTGGRVFDSRKHSLAHAFKQIRGYQ